jgi:hypothetical protein
MVELTQTLDLDLDYLTTDEVLDQLVQVREPLAALKARDEALFDRLDQLAEAGEVDQGGFSHLDYSFSWSAGKRSWTYPAGVLGLEAQAKAAKKAAEADGTATATTGSPFWTIKSPRP